MGKFPAPAAFSGRFFPLLSHRSGGNSNRKWGVCTLILNKIGPQIPHPLGEAAPAAKSFPVWAPKSIGILGMLGVLGDGMSCGCGCGWGYHRQPPNRRAAALQLVGRKSLARGQGILPLEFVVGIPGEHMDRAGNGGFSAGKGSFSREKEGSAPRAPPKMRGERGEPRSSLGFPLFGNQGHSRPWCSLVLGGKLDYSWRKRHGNVWRGREGNGIPPAVDFSGVWEGWVEIGEEFRVLWAPGVSRGGCIKIFLDDGIGKYPLTLG